MVISYESYETSLWRVSYISYEMTTSVRFCLSYDCPQLDFIALNVDIISTENITLSRTASCRYAPVTSNVWSYDFYDMTLATEQQQRHMIKNHVQTAREFHDMNMVFVV